MVFLDDIVMRIGSASARISEGLANFDDSTTYGGLRKAAAYNAIIGAYTTEFLINSSIPLALMSMGTYVGITGLLIYQAHQEEKNSQS